MITYGQFCPLSKAAEVLCPRWSLLVVRELLAGSTRFRDIQRGVPGCPPATLSKRLKELVAAGVAQRVDSMDGVGYALTAAGQELQPIVDGMGMWGHRWVRSTYDEKELDAEMLLWDMRQYLDPAGLDVPRAVIELALALPGGGRRTFWIVVDPTAVDICMIDPKRTVDAVVAVSLRVLTRIWMGEQTFAQASAVGEVSVSGSRSLVRRLPNWLGQHPFLVGVPRGVRPVPRAPVRSVHRRAATSTS